MSIKIKKVLSNFEREPLLRPFGFKGGYMKEIWQIAALMESDSGIKKMGLGTQNALWSDASVFARYSPAAAEGLMYLLTEFALRESLTMSFDTPFELLHAILPAVFKYGQKITGLSNLRKTFVLNALVPLDNAAWLLYAAEKEITRFEDLIPHQYRSVFSYHHHKVASIPLMAYGVPVQEIKQAVNDGYFFMKIKIGQPGSQTEMLEKDKARIAEIHQAIGSFEIAHTKNGKIPYYFDANGRYENKDTLLRLVDFTREIGAFDQIVIIEEPFSQEYHVDVSDIPVRLAADESAHTDKEALERIEMGYKAIALKAIAKTLSMTLKIAQVAVQNHIPCFCADLTVNPILVDWNKNFAARLAPFPGLENMGVLETNGHQNYKNWIRMKKYHPCFGHEWTNTKQGFFTCDSDFYEKNGGIFEQSRHYLHMLT